MALRAADVSVGANQSGPAVHELAAGRRELDHRLSTLRPSSLGSRAALDANLDAIGRATGESGRRRRGVQLPLAVWRRGRALGSHRRAGGEDARFLAAGRLL